MSLPKPKDTRGYTTKEIKKICKDRKISMPDFNDAFGVNTCCYDKKSDTYYFYIYDVERALYNLRNKDGIFHCWD
jgi:hypothetical protein